jgi:hypothetical protein
MDHVPGKQSSVLTTMHRLTFTLLPQGTTRYFDDPNNPQYDVDGRSGLKVDNSGPVPIILVCALCPTCPERHRDSLPEVTGR